MWITLLGTLLLLGLTQAQSSPLEYDRDDETPNVETPYFVTLNFQIEKVLNSLLADQQEYLEDRLHTLELKIEETCLSNQIQGQQIEYVDLENFSVEMAGIMNKIVAKMAEMTDMTVGKIDEKIGIITNEVVSSVDNRISSLASDLAQIQEKIPTLASKEDLIQLKSKISTMTVTSVTDVKNVLSTLASETLVSTMMQELTDNELAGIKQMIRNLATNITTCENEEILNRILASLESTKNDKEELIAALGAAISDVSDSQAENARNLMAVFQNLANEVEENQQVFSLVDATIKEIKSDVTPRLTALQNGVDEINDNMQAPPPTTTTTTARPTTTTTPETLQPCEDSTFRGSANLAIFHPSITNICGTAIRFKTCHLQFVSYHCCRSCTSAGQIPPIGPWRYLNYPREINVLQALDFIRP